MNRVSEAPMDSPVESYDDGSYDDPGADMGMDDGGASDPGIDDYSEY